MMTKEIIAGRHDEFLPLSLSEIAKHMAQLQLHAVACVNWPAENHGNPQCQVAVAYNNSNLYVHFIATDDSLRAVHTQPLSPVAQDSCVEVFLSVPGSPEYWNFEFNCIGTVNASHRVERPNAVRLTPAEIGTIGRYASLGTNAFEEKEGRATWELTVSIPLNLIGLDATKTPTAIKANFYKCAGKTRYPHYLSWSPIAADRPNFHCPEFFGNVTFS